MSQEMDKIRKEFEERRKKRRQEREKVTQQQTIIAEVLIPALDSLGIKYKTWLKGDVANIEAIVGYDVLSYTNRKGRNVPFRFGSQSDEGTSFALILRIPAFEVADKLEEVKKQITAMSDMIGSQKTLMEKYHVDYPESFRNIDDLPSPSCCFPLGNQYYLSAQLNEETIAEDSVAILGIVNKFRQALSDAKSAFGENNVSLCLRHNEEPTRRPQDHEMIF